MPRKGKMRLAKNNFSLLRELSGSKPLFHGLVSEKRLEAAASIALLVEQSQFTVYEGQHEAVISEEDRYLAEEKRKNNSFKREKVNNPDHAHVLSDILKYI